MNPKTVRLKKEARPLLLPWCLVTLVGALPLVHRADWNEGFTLMAFMLGLPLLAALPLGNEFQHRTLSLLLTEPVERMGIWGEKFSVTVVAVLSADLVFYLGWHLGAIQQTFPTALLAGFWVIAIMASATFWTLFTRSTIGGVALNISINFFMFVGWQRVLEWREAIHYPRPVSNTFLVSAGLVFLFYAGAMLWLGRRKLARFQVTGGMAGDDLLMSGPDVMPGALARWFRCRPTGAVFNLIRKELRLLRPLWLLTLLAALGWACLTVQRGLHGSIGMVPASGSTKNVPVAELMTFVFAVFGTLLLPVLAGSLSLGEERTSGTHAWHMTLPVSPRRQWLVKLVMALFAGFVSAVLVPGLVLIACGYLFGSPFRFVDVYGGIAWMLMVLLLSFASFWCACAVNGTVRAALWVFPMLAALSLAGQFGRAIAERLMPLIFSKFDFFSRIPFINAVSKFPFSFYLYRISPSAIYFNRYPVGGIFDLLAAIALAPIVVFGVLQSYRMFRAQVQDGLEPFTREFLPLATMVLLCSISLSAYLELVGHAEGQNYSMFRTLREVHLAIEKIHPDIPNLDAAHPLQLTVDDLVKAHPLSESTRSWLHGSTISLAPDQADTRECCRFWNSEPYHPYGGQLSYPLYIATIHLAGGSELKLFSGDGGIIEVIGGSECTLFFYGGRFSDVADGVCE